MLSPKKVQHRKQMKRSQHLKGTERRGSFVAFGDYGLMATTPGWITNRQIEAARIAISRSLKKGGKLWIRVFPDKPLTKKPAEVRMGKGKGAPEQWVAVIRPGRIMYEVKGVPKDNAQEAFRLAGAKLACRTRFIARAQFSA